MGLQEYNAACQSLNYVCLIKNVIENFHIDNLPCFKKLEYLSNLLPLVGLCHEEICRLILSVGLK